MVACEFAPIPAISCSHNMPFPKQRQLLFDTSQVLVSGEEDAKLHGNNRFLFLVGDGCLLQLVRPVGRQQNCLPVVKPLSITASALHFVCG